ncbi:MAG: hypothetical protein Q7T65_04025 [Thiobacillus sp.]|nr:hypothetical protein [Thiobacillus sp.]
MSQSFAVLVLSCDKYADVWPVFFKCFRENFPAGDWPVYLGSNTKKCNEPGVVTILSGSDPDWSTSYKRILEQIPQKKVFVILEDLFLSSKVDENVLGTLVKFLFEKDANHIRYWASPAPDLPTDNSLIGACAKGAPYRSTVCGFWDRDYLLKLLIEGENPWNFEILGSYRTSYSDGFYATTSPLCEFKNMIEKGRWIPASVDWANSNGVSLPLEARPMLKGGSQLISRAQMIIFSLILRIPWQHRVRLMNQLRKLFISY